jgi:hypothetical protein
VASFALTAPSRTILIDPLAPEPAGDFWERLDAVVAGDVVVLVTIPYHVRSSADVCTRYPGTTVWGHANARRRLPGLDGFRELSPDHAPDGVRAFTIGRPRRTEMPVLVESHRALAFGDAVVEWEGELRMWATDHVDERRRRFYAERFAPTLEPMLAADVDHVLVTHGAPVIGDGRAALAAAAAAPPWYHHG